MKHSPASTLCKAGLRTAHLCACLSGQWGVPLLARQESVASTLAQTLDALGEGPL